MMRPMLWVYRGPDDVEAVDLTKLKRKTRPGQVRSALGIAAGSTRGKAAVSDQEGGPEGDAEPRTPGEQPWWIGLELLTVGQFLSIVRPGVASTGVQGNKIMSWAKANGHSDQMQRVGQPGNWYNVWPIAKLVEYFDGRLVEGVTVDAKQFWERREAYLRQRGGHTAEAVKRPQPSLQEDVEDMIGGRAG